jgi:hypothetical protein
MKPNEVNLETFSCFCKLHDCSDCPLIEIVKLDEYRSCFRVIRNAPVRAQDIVAKYFEDLTGE